MRAVVLCAPAPARDTLEMTLRDVSAITAPVNIYVAENDVYMAEHVELARDVEEALRDAGKEVDLTIYPPYGADGHALFFEVRDSYFDDVLAFFDEHLR
jgi:dienelactone hydrolase